VQETTLAVVLPSASLKPSHQHSQDYNLSVQRHLCSVTGYFSVKEMQISIMLV